MSYVRPPPLAANVSWEGVGAYSRPAASTANASWAPSAEAQTGGVTGFRSIAFGAPVHIGDASFLATGFQVGQFGTPTIQPRALGFSATRFGSAGELNAIWPGDGTLPGWTKNTGSIAWQYTDSVGYPTLGCMRSTVSGYNTAVLQSPLFTFGNDWTINVALNLFLSGSNRFRIQAQEFGGEGRLLTLIERWSNTPWEVFEFLVPAGSWQITLTHSGGGGSLSNAYVDSFYVDGTLRAQGFSNVRFGTPSAFDLVPEGFMATKFGMPTFVSNHKADAIRPIASFGTPLALDVDRVVEVSGALVARFGKPYVFLPSAVEYRLITSAWQFKATKFGTPTSPVASHAFHYGWRRTRFGKPALGARPLTKYGTHRAAVVTRASAASASTQFGAPSGGLEYRATGARFGSFGTPSHVETHVATSIRRRARFGRPNSRTFAHTTYGFSRHGRFGQPTVHTPMFYPEGFCPTRFGEHAGAEYHYALHIPPETRFGTPLMKRHV